MYLRLLEDLLLQTHNLCIKLLLRLLLALFVQSVQHDLRTCNKQVANRIVDRLIACQLHKVNVS